METIPYAIIDQSSFPLITVTFTGEKSTDANFKSYLKQLDDCYLTQQKIAFVFDASNALIPRFSHQKLQAKWIKQNTILIQKYCKANSLHNPK